MATANAIIFGSNGQDGYFLKEILKKNNLNIITISRKGENTFLGDVGDFNFVEEIIKSFKPKYVFHLAANSTTKHNALFENHNSISNGTINILEAVKRHSVLTNVFLSGSAMQFENNGKPIDESTPFSASSAYSVARIQSVYAGRYYRERFNMKVYIGYFFNHDSSLRDETHVNQKIIRSLQRIIKGSSEKLCLGNIDVKKEFNYAGDIVEAVWDLVNQTSVFEAVIGSGKAYSIRDWLTYCFNFYNLDWKNYVEIDNKFIAEYDILVSSPRLINTIGWKEKVNFEALAEKMINNIN